MSGFYLLTRQAYKIKSIYKTRIRFRGIVKIRNPGVWPDQVVSSEISLGILGPDLR